MGLGLGLGQVVELVGGREVTLLLPLPLTPTPSPDLVEVVELVGGLERLEVEQVRAEGVDQRVERHAVLPRRVEVGDVDRTVGALRHL